MQSELKQKFDAYPASVRPHLMRLRKTIFDVATRHKLGPVAESLKWGEPSYTVPGGSAVRLDWKPKNPQQYAVYFNCQSRLVPTFRELYGDRFCFQGNRAMVFDVGPLTEIEAFEHCILLALTYHQVKHLPLLGN